MRVSSIVFFLVIFFTYCSVYGQWVKTSFPEFTYTNSSYCVVDDYIFISNNTGTGFYRSYDDGETWDSLVDKLPSGKRVGAMINYGKSIIIDTWDWHPDSNGGIYHSSDYGESWIKSTGNGSQISFFTQFHNYPTVLFAIGPTAGVFRSFDEGENWEYVSESIQGELTGIASQEGHLYISTKFNGVYHSNDDGTSWVKPSSSNLPNLVFAISSFQSIPSLIIASSDFVYKLQDTIDWIKLASSSVIYGSRNFISYHNIMFAGCNGDSKPVYYSSNLGETWIDYSDSFGNDKVYLLFVKENYLFLGKDDGVWRRPLSDLSVVKEKDLLTLTILPSPALDYISITIPEGVNAKSLSIIDILGRTVYSANTLSQQIHVSHLPSGYYKVICTSDKGAVSGSFTK